MYLQASGPRTEMHSMACCTISMHHMLCRRVMQSAGVEADAHLHGVLIAAVSGA